MEKITKREMYQALIRFAETGVMSYPAKEEGVDDPTVTSEELKAFAENEIVLLDKKLNKAKENAKKNIDSYFTFLSKEKKEAAAHFANLYVQGTYPKAAAFMACECQVLTMSMVLYVKSIR